MIDNNKQQWKTPKLGLAAFAKLHGATVLSVDGRDFSMLSEETKSECELRYANSEANRFNIELIGLNELRRKDHQK